MIRGGRVSFASEWERDGELIELDVVAKISDYHPPIYRLSNGDPGWPAEGGEVEDMTVRLPDGTELENVPEPLYNSLCEQATEIFWSDDGR